MKMVNFFKYPGLFDVHLKLENTETEIPIGVSVGREDTPDPFCFYFRNLANIYYFICLSLILVFAKNGKLF